MGNCAYTNTKGESHMIVLAQSRHGKQSLTFCGGKVIENDDHEPEVVYGSVVRLGHQSIEHEIHFKNYMPYYKNTTASVPGTTKEIKLSDTPFDEFFAFCDANINNLVINYVMNDN